MDGARASSSAMSLDAAGELSRTDKRTPTYSHPRYLSPARSGRYPSCTVYTCRLTLPCADTPASCKLDNLRASSRASIGRRGRARYGGNRMTRRQFEKEENAFSLDLQSTKWRDAVNDQWSEVCACLRNFIQNNIIFIVFKKRIVNKKNENLFVTIIYTNFFINISLNIQLYYISLLHINYLMPYFMSHNY